MISCKYRIISLFLALSMLFSTAACSQTDSDPSSVAEAAAETRIFSDDCGRDVEIPAKIERIVPSGSLAQIILMAIAPDMFVGVASSFQDKDRGVVDEGLFDLPKFGSLYAGADLNVEEMALADPDLIIDIGDSKKTAAEDLDKLQEQTQIPSVYLYATLENMPQTYRTLGKLLGREEKGEELAAFCEKVYERTLNIMEKVGDNKVDALYVLGEEGLNVIASGSYHAELLDLLCNNLAVVDNPVSKGTGNEVTMEQISLWDPDFVIFAADSIYDTVKEIPAWNQVSAIVKDAYVEVPNVPHGWMGMPPSVQRYLGLIWLTAELYPEYCDYDVKAEILEYYELFYGCSLSDEQYENITAHTFRK